MQPRAGRIGAAERAGGYEDRRLEAGRGRPRANREYILYLRTYALPYACGVCTRIVVSLRVCGFGVSFLGKCCVTDTLCDSESAV